MNWVQNYSLLSDSQEHSFKESMVTTIISLNVNEACIQGCNCATELGFYFKLGMES